LELLSLEPPSVPMLGFRPPERFRNPFCAPSVPGWLYAGRFEGRVGGSSSSLPVRSMTWLAGRLVLEDGRRADEAVDCSRDRSGVIFCNGRWIDLGSSFKAEIRVSCISMRSSSASAFIAPFPNPIDDLVSPGFDHSPLGSTVTCSTAGEVDRRISSTYLSS
jgi:hypothetical protein